MSRYLSRRMSRGESRQCHVTSRDLHPTPLFNGCDTIHRYGPYESGADAMDEAADAARFGGER